MPEVVALKHRPGDPTCDFGRVLLLFGGYWLEGASRKMTWACLFGVEERLNSVSNLNGDLANIGPRLNISVGLSHWIIEASCFLDDN
jgi:hypothetical protein